MNKVMLINKLDPESKSDKKHKVFFLLGGLKDIEVEKKLIEIINKSKLVESKNMVLKYNGVDLGLKIEDIPLVTKLLVENDIEVYGIYQTYTPDEDFL